MTNDVCALLAHRTPANVVAYHRDPPLPHPRFCKCYPRLPKYAPARRGLARGAELASAAPGVISCGVREQGGRRQVGDVQHSVQLPGARLPGIMLLHATHLSKLDGLVTWSSIGGLHDADGHARAQAGHLSHPDIERSKKGMRERQLRCP